MEEYTPEEQQSAQSNSEEIKRWFQDNLRIIVSIIIVVLIAGGIYSYSKRSVSPEISSEETTVETENITSGDVDQNASGVSKDQSQTSEKKESSVKTTEQKEEPSSSASSKETEGSFVETAGKGDGLTVLARRSLANYLEKSPDSTLTKEHKIYIEDYLRKNVGHKGGIAIGSSVEFSKDLIQEAISHSKNLNEKQLKNLEKYSARVPSLS